MFFILSFLKINYLHVITNVVLKSFSHQTIFHREDKQVFSHLFTGKS